MLWEFRNCNTKTRALNSFFIVYLYEIRSKIKLHSWSGNLTKRGVQIFSQSFGLGIQHTKANCLFSIEAQQQISYLGNYDFPILKIEVIILKMVSMIVRIISEGITYHAVQKNTLQDIFIESNFSIFGICWPNIASNRSCYSCILVTIPTMI